MSSNRLGFKHGLQKAFFLILTLSILICLVSCASVSNEESKTEGKGALYSKDDQTAVKAEDKETEHDENNADAAKKDRDKKPVEYKDEDVQPAALRAKLLSKMPELSKLDSYDSATKILPISVFSDALKKFTSSGDKETAEKLYLYAIGLLEKKELEYFEELKQKGLILELGLVLAEEKMSNSQKRYIKELEEAGIRIINTESGVYLTYDYDYFSPQLAELRQCFKDYNRILVEDKISMVFAKHKETSEELRKEYDDLADRIIFREKFLIDYPNSPFSLEVFYSLYENVDMYINHSNMNESGRFLTDGAEYKLVFGGDGIVKLNDAVRDSYKGFLDRDSKLYDGFYAYYSELESRAFKWQKSDPDLYKLHDVSFVSRSFGAPYIKYTIDVNAAPRELRALDEAIDALFSENKLPFCLVLSTKSEAEYKLCFGDEKINRNVWQGIHTDEQGRRLNRRSTFDGSRYIYWYPELGQGASYGDSAYDWRIFDFKRTMFRGLQSDEKFIRYTFQADVKAKDKNHAWIDYIVNKSSGKLSGISLYFMKDFDKYKRMDLNVGSISQVSKAELAIPTNFNIVDMGADSYEDLY